MSKCREAYEAQYPYPYTNRLDYETWQTAWNARGKLDAEICRTSGNPHQLQSIAESVWTLATAQHCAEAIEQEQCA